VSGEELERWASEVEPGDVVEAPSGMLRMVRRVSRKHGCAPRKVWVYFTIQRSSWTRRPYTLYNVGELAQLGYRPLGVRAIVDEPFTSKLLSCTDKPSSSCFELRPWDVIGIP
jgi:hypothetical protein